MAKHPSLNLQQRVDGFGIGGGHERPYKRNESPTSRLHPTSYGPIPHSGYYGSAESSLRFRLGQATFNQEISLYKSQFGQETVKAKKE